MSLIVFDMDGTLLDTRIDITISVNYVRMKNHALPPLTQEQVVEYINRDERNLPQLFYGTETPDPQDRELFRRHYLQQCTKHLRLFSGVETMLESLRRAGIPMAVATNASSLFAHQMLEAAGIAHYFYAVAGADTTGRSKPDPSMLHFLMRQIGFDPNEKRGYLLGDSGKDMEAARRAGLVPLYAAWGYANGCEADRSLQTPEALCEVLSTPLSIQKEESRQCS
ncbi:HAD family hydrolase [Nitratifractor sp.]